MSPLVLIRRPEDVGDMISGLQRVRGNMRRLADNSLGGDTAGEATDRRRVCACGRALMEDRINMLNSPF